MHNSNTPHFRGWDVSDPALCADDASTCTDPKPMACTFRGCEKLPEIPADKSEVLSYLGTPERSLKGGTTSLLCGAGPDVPRLPAVLSSLQNPDNVLALDQDVWQKPKGNPPDWCPHESCFTVGTNTFRVDNYTDNFSNCFEKGYSSYTGTGKLVRDEYDGEPRCAKASAMIFDGTGYVWNSGQMPSSKDTWEECAQSGGQPCPSAIPQTCPAAECILASLPWTDPLVPGLIHYGCSYANEKGVFGGTALMCPKRSDIMLVDDRIQVAGSAGMTACLEILEDTPCETIVPRMMAKRKAKKKLHVFQLKECDKGFTFLAWNTSTMATAEKYLVFDGSYLEDSYTLMRQYELAASDSESEACLEVTHGLCGPNAISLSPPGYEELLLTDCGDRIHFRRENDFCESKLSQCWFLAFQELDEDIQESKFLITPLEGRVLAESDTELAEILEARLRKKGLDEVAAFSAPTLVGVTCLGQDQWQFDNSELKDADVLTDLIRLPCMSTHVCVDPPKILIADPPKNITAKLTVTTPGVEVLYACPPDFLFDDKKTFPADIAGICTNNTIFDINFPYWIIPGLNYPSVTDLICLNTMLCKDIPTVRIQLFSSLNS